MKDVRIERPAIERALKTQPNITKAAESLGASRRTLQNRMRYYHIPRGQSGRPRQLLPKGIPVGVATTAGLVLGGMLGALVFAVWWARKKTVAVAGETQAVRLTGIDVLAAS